MSGVCDDGVGVSIPKRLREEHATDDSGAGGRNKLLTHRDDDRDDDGKDERVIPIPGSNEPFAFVTGSPKGSEGVMYNPARRDSLKAVF